MTSLAIIDYATALQRICDAVQATGVEDVPLDAAHRRVLAQPLVAPRDTPPHPTSAMDGYALRRSDFDGGTTCFRNVGVAAAGGGFAGMVGTGECVRIFTGAPLPAGCDHVIIQENVTVDGSSVTITCPDNAMPHVRAAGMDFRAGDKLLAAGTYLTPRAMVTAAAADVAQVPVHTRPRVHIIATGDELVAPGDAAGNPRHIPESVGFGIAALVADMGGVVVGRDRIGDDLSALEQAAGRALANADLVIATGGASVGERDFAKTMFAPHGLDLIFAKVAIKPGKPVWFGRAGRTMVMGLPGNPTSAMVTARLLLVPLLAALAGRNPTDTLIWRKIPLGAPLRANGDRELFTRARLVEGQALPVNNQDSSAQKMLAAADILIRQPAHGPALDAGQWVDALDF